SLFGQVLVMSFYLGGAGTFVENAFCSRYLPCSPSRGNTWIGARVRAPHLGPGGSNTCPGTYRLYDSAEALEDGGHVLTTTDAHGLQTKVLVVELASVDQGT